MRIIELEDDADRALIGGFAAREETRSRLNRDREVFRDRVGRYRGQEYLERFEDRSRSLDVELIARRSIAIGRKIQHAFSGDMIYDLERISDFQHLGSRMQDYMLSDPEINYRARNQRMEAWGRPRDEYAYREDHDRHANPYYRSMNDSYLRRCDDNHDDMEAVCYLGQVDGEMEMLSHDEKMALHRNVALLKDLLGEFGAEDPTSPSNNLL